MREFLAIVIMFAAVMGVVGSIEVYNPPQPAAKVEQAAVQDPKTETMDMEVTAYCYTGNRTASGTWPKKGTIAADPKILPFGTKIYVPGYGIGTVEDTGGAIKGNRLDVYIPSRAQAITWGRQQVKVHILSR